MRNTMQHVYDRLWLFACDERTATRVKPGEVGVGYPRSWGNHAPTLRQLFVPHPVFVFVFLLVVEWRNQITRRGHPPRQNVAPLEDSFNEPYSCCAPSFCALHVVSSPFKPSQSPQQYHQPQTSPSVHPCTCCPNSQETDQGFSLTDREPLLSPPPSTPAPAPPRPRLSPPRKLAPSPPSPPPPILAFAGCGDGSCCCRWQKSSTEPHCLRHASPGRSEARDSQVCMSTTLSRWQTSKPCVPSGSSWF